jgi:hypothetical protein
VTAKQLRRVRWAARAALVLGVAASVTANVLHARDNPISQVIAAWPPLALLVTVALIERVPVHGRKLAITRVVTTAVIAAIAAWVSYWHMAAVALRYGEAAVSAHLLPLTVDGLVIVASVCLVELGARIADAERPASPELPPLITVQLPEGTIVDIDRRTEQVVGVTEPPKPAMPPQPEPPAFPVPDPGKPEIVQPDKPAKPEKAKPEPKPADPSAKTGRTGVIKGREVPVPEGATVVDDRIVSGEELRQIGRGRYQLSVLRGSPYSQRELAATFDPPMSQFWANARIREVQSGRADPPAGQINGNAPESVPVP